MGQDTGTRKGVSWAEEGTKTKNDDRDEEKAELRSKSSRWRPWRSWDWKKLRPTFSHIGLLLTLTGYTAAGGLVFRALEQPAESTRLLSLQRNMLDQRADLVAALSSSSNSETALRLLPVYEEALSAAARAGLSPPSPTDSIDPRDPGGTPPPPPAPPSRWSILQAVFFASTVLTTIGYGNLVPVTVAGRAFCLLFALVGIPLTMTVIADMGRLLAEGVAALPCCNVCRRWWQRGEGAGRRAVLALLAVALLLMYLAVGATLFMFWEKDWSFFDGFYFCFITMTTIGFGDLVPSEPSYMLLCTVYILSGLALTSTIIELVRRQYASSWKHLQKLSGPILADTIRRLSVAPTGLSGLGNLAGLASLAGLNGDVQIRRALAASLARAANGGAGGLDLDDDLELAKVLNLSDSGLGLRAPAGALNKDVTSNADKSEHVVDEVWKQALSAALRDLQRDSRPRPRRPRVLEIIIYETSV